MLLYKQMKSIVVAYDYKRTIGRNNQLPWAGQLPADMRRFKELTEGSSVIMGRKTWESLPDAYRPLPNRENIVISMSQTALQGAQVAHGMEDAFSKASGEIMVIGGASVYEQALPLADRVFATQINTYTPDGDAFFLKLPLEEWEITEHTNHLADQRNRFAYSFITYLRRTPTER